MNVLYILIFMIAVSCGVNTGNPSDSPKTGTSLVIDMSQGTSNDKVTFNITAVNLKGANGNVNVDTGSTVRVQTGKKATYFPKETYRRIPIPRLS